MKWLLSALFAFLCSGIVSAAPEPETPPANQPIEITCDGENKFLGGIATAEDNVIVHYKDQIIYCDRLTYNMKTKVAVCKGNVRIYSDEHLYRGDTIIYNFETKEMQSADFRLAAYPAFTAGDEVISPGPNHYRVHNGFFTTENRSDPGFKMEAQTLEIYPNDSVVLKNIIVYAGSVPVLWLPIYAQAIDDDRAAYQWVIGSSSSMGPYFYNRYNWVYNERVKGTIHIDFREKRGFAGGLDTEYKKNDDNKALFRVYYAQDNLYSDGDDLSSGKDARYRYPDVNSENRYRVTLKENFQIGPDLQLLTDINKWSDPYVTLDYFEREYESERQPDNFVEAVQYSPHYTLSLLARDQSNDFFDTVERKPEVKLDLPRQKLLNTPLSYEGQTSMTVFDRRFGTTNSTSTALAVGNQDYDAYRYDTFHQILYPKQYFNWLNVTPRLGLRGTYWSDDNLNMNDVNPDGYKNKDAASRFVPDVGLESSFKVSRVWSDVQNKDLGINGLRHVAEPFINAQYIPKDFGASPDDLRGFDTRLASTRLAPINFPDYNSIDSIDRQAVVRHGIRNKLQTERDGENVDLVDWVLYADLDAFHNFSTTQSNQSYSNVFNDIKISPVPWLTFNSQTSANIYEDTYSEYNNDVTWQISRAYRIRVGSRYIANSPLFPNSNLFELNNFYRLNEHWQFETNHRFEANGGDLQEQSYTVYRDLTSWLASATFRERYISDRQNEVAFYISLTLKAFPAAEFTTNPLR